jgi:ABC-type oligopeptide transport system ATPase subunit
MLKTFVEIRELTKKYILSSGLFNPRKRIIYAVNNIDLQIAENPRWRA